MTESRRSPSAAAGEPQITVARYPFELGRNPYQGFLYRALESRGVALRPDRPFTATALLRGRARCQALHFNWRLDRLYGSSGSDWRVAVARLRLHFAKLLGYRVAWTVHELPSSYQPAIGGPITDTLARVADVFFCHDVDLADRVALQLGVDRSRIEVIPHGPLDSAYAPARARPEETRARLGIDPGDTVFIAFGVMREYKQLDFLLRAFARVSSPGVRLLLVGEPEAVEHVAALREVAARDQRVVTIDRRIPDSEVRDLAEASDVWVCARRDGWTSGSLVLGLNLGLPAIVAACPAYLRLIGDGQSGWAFDPEAGEAALTAKLEEAAELAPEARRSMGARAAAASHELTWEDAADRIAIRLKAHERPAPLVFEPDTVDA